MAKKTGAKGRKAEMARLLKDAPRDDVWQVDVFPSPMPTREGKEAGFPPLGMVVHPRSRFIVALEAYALGEEPVACLGGAILAGLQKHGRLPLEVQVRRKDWAEALARTAELMGFRVVVDEKLAELTEVRREFEEGMEKRMAPGGKWGRA